jgi:hypothetical protein
MAKLDAAIDHCSHNSWVIEKPENIILLNRINHPISPLGVCAIGWDGE